MGRGIAYGFVASKSKSKNIKPDHERDERAEQFALCSLLFELKFPNAIALSVWAREQSLNI
jgi:hypothetical protein